MLLEDSVSKHHPFPQEVRSVLGGLTVVLKIPPSVNLTQPTPTGAGSIREDLVVYPFPSRLESVQRSNLAVRHMSLIY